jgi:HK97 family phage major capsid protein
MDLEVKNAFDNIQKAVHDLHVANNEQIKNVAKGFDDVIKKEEIDKINNAIDDLHDKLKAVESAANRPALGGSDKDIINTRAKEFFNALRKNKNEKLIVNEEKIEQFVRYENAFAELIQVEHVNNLSSSIRNDLMIGSDSSAGYYLPPVTYSGIEKRIFETSPVRQVATVVQTANRSFSKLFQAEEFSDGGWVGETTPPVVTDTPEVGKSEIYVFEQYAQPRMTQQTLEDVGFNIEAWVASQVAEKLARTENTAFVSGNGVNKPRGFLDYATTAVTTSDTAGRDWGKLQYIPSGAAAGLPKISGATLAAKTTAISSLVDELNPAYLNNAVFVMNRRTRSYFRNLVDENGKPLIEYNLTQGNNFTILGYPIVIMEDMPALAGNSFSVAFGDFSAYQIVDRLGLSLLRDPFTDKPWIKYYFRRRVGGDLVNFDKIKLMKFAVS